jgi:RES domain-containing protein
VYAFRLSRAPFDALDGEGARPYGGRWNSPGVAVVYAAASRALAALEYLANVDVADVPDDLVLLTIEVPDDALGERVDPASLPAGWARVPPAAASRGLGDAWAAARRSLVLQVPAVLVPEEDNVLLNPAHAGMADVRVASRRPFAFDERLLRAP